MKILVFGGSGKMGTAVAYDLVRSDAVTTVGLVGRNPGALEETRRWLGSAKVRTHALDLTVSMESRALLSGYDVGVIALPDRRSSYRTVELAIQAGLSCVDILEEFHRQPDAYETEGLELPAGVSLGDYGQWLHEAACKNGVTLLDGFGFAPGLSNLTVGEALRKLDPAASVIARVGGIPSKATASRHPLRYMITWSFQHVLREYMIGVKILRDGAVVEVPATTILERFRFDQMGRDEWLECAVTPGMPSLLFTRPQLQNFSERTVRWPGHFAAIETLRDCGLLGLQPVEFAGTRIVPRDFLRALVEPRLRAQPEDADACVMLNSITGTRQGKPVEITYHMWVESAPNDPLSAMARVTGFTAAIAAVFLGKGLIQDKGILPPEDCIHGELYSAFVKELRTRGIDILETQTEGAALF